MIRASLEDAKTLLNDWRERGIWIGVGLLLREDAREEHRFWAKVLDAREGELVLAGEYALVKLPLESAAVFEYGETSEAPADLRDSFSDFEFCFTIRSQRVMAFLFGGKPNPE
ncbi:MAG: hypothetical protein ABSA70_16300 [Terriglobia bacterium]